MIFLSKIIFLIDKIYFILEKLKKKCRINILLNNLKKKLHIAALFK